jgi:hypothetical protein
VMALLGSWCFWIDFSTTNISKETWDWILGINTLKI